MSFSKEKKIRIQKYIVEKILQDDPYFVQKTVDNFFISSTTVKRYINEFLVNNVIEKNKENKCKYSLSFEESTYRYSQKNQQLEEHIIFHNDILPYIIKLPENIKKIWAYAFNEIMNNAIEHSDSDIILCRVHKDYLNTEIMIIDLGVGIFNKICSYIKETTGDEITTMDAVTELFKGKLTTASSGHSGEGIFFTSRVLDNFLIVSSNVFFTHNNDFDLANEVSSITKDVEREKNIKNINNNGTTVLLRMANNSSRDIKEVFDMYTTIDEGFVKTDIPIKNICEFGYPVSRSQARRLYNRFDKFKELTLDFKGVSDIGQAFAHEIFVVFQNGHPDIKIKYLNANDNVIKMIKHVLNTTN